MDSLPIIPLSTPQGERGIAECRELLKSLTAILAGVVETRWRFLRQEDDFLGEGEWNVANDYGANMLVLLVLTGGVERRALDFVLSVASPSLVVILAHNEWNSLAAATELLAALQQREICGRIIQFIVPQTTDLNSMSVQEIVSLRALGRARYALQKTKIGVVGEPSDWLVASVPHAYSSVQERWGCKIVDIPLRAIADEFGTIPVSQEITHLARTLLENADDVCEPQEDAAVVRAAKLYAVLRNVVDRMNLTCLTVRCFDLISSINTTACYALSRLNDDGVVSACEGDIASAVTMAIVRCVTGLESFMANPQRVDVSQNTVELAHCTLPLNMVQTYRVRTHFESGGAVALEGLFAPLPNATVTLLRVGGRKLERIFLAVGKMLPQRPNLPSRCRTQISVRLGPAHSVRYFLDAPLGNHHVLVLGNHEKALKDYFALFSTRSELITL